MQLKDIFDFQNA